MQIECDTESCQSLVRVLSESCQSFVRVLSEFCQSSVRVLPVYCQSPPDFSILPDLSYTARFIIFCQIYHMLPDLLYSARLSYSARFILFCQIYPIQSDLRIVARFFIFCQIYHINLDSSSPPSPAESWAFDHGTCVVAIVKKRHYEVIKAW